MQSKDLITGRRSQVLRSSTSLPWLHHRGHVTCTYTNGKSNGVVMRPLSLPGEQTGVLERQAAQSPTGRACRIEQCQMGKTISAISDACMVVTGVLELPRQSDLERASSNGRASTSQPATDRRIIPSMQPVQTPLPVDFQLLGARLCMQQRPGMQL